MKNFIENIINIDEFETTFTILYEKAREDINMFVIDLKQIEKFQPSTRSDQFSSFIISILREFEAVEGEYCTWQEVKDYVEKIYSKLCE